MSSLRFSKMRVLSSFAFVLSAVVLTACGGGENPDRVAAASVPDNQKVGSQRFETLGDASALKIGAGEVSGTGKLRLADPLAEAASQVNYEIEFSLEDGGSITFIAHANRDLSSGVNLTFKRVGNALKLSTPGISDREAEEWSTFFKDVKADQTVKLYIDIHNDDKHPTAHVIFWDRSKPATGEDKPIFDASEDANGMPGKGSGPYLGFELNRATLKNFTRGDARDPH